MSETIHTRVKKKNIPPLKRIKKKFKRRTLNDTMNVCIEIVDEVEQFMDDNNVLMLINPEDDSIVRIKII